MAGFVPFRNICAIFNCIAFKLILCFNSATSYTRKTLAVIATATFQNEICGGIKSVTLPQDGQTCLYPLPCGM